MKRKIHLIITAILLISMIGSFSACGGNDNNEESTTEGNSVAMSTEKSGGLVKMDTPTENFYGTWTATSEKAKYLYGELEFTINEDGTWAGIVNYEDLHGTWEEKDFGIHLHDEVLDWESDLFYTDKGNFVLDEDDLEMSGRIVLTRVE